MKTISQVNHKPRKVARLNKTRLQELREKAGLSMREIARFSGISVSTISRIEGGKSPDIHTALRLAKFFESKVEDLFSEESSK